MGIVSKIKNLLSANNKYKDNIIIYYLVKHDDYTGIDRYYECKFDRENLHFEADMLIKEPSDVEINDLDEFIKKFGFSDLIYSAISRANSRYENDIKSSNLFFRMEELYKLDEKDKNERVANAWNKCLELLDILEDKSKEFGINSETDVDKIYMNIIYEINKHEKKEADKSGYSLASYINFSYSKDAIDEEINRAILDKHYNTRNFYYERMYLVGYYSSFIDSFPLCIKLLDRHILTDDEKKIIKRYLNSKYN